MAHSQAPLFAVDAQGLRKSYGSNEVLKGLDLQVAKGTMLALLGPNGAGKTTTIRILSTLIQADAGTVRINGFDLASQASQVRASIGLTGQSAAVDELLTGRENLVMMGRLYRLAKSTATARAQELLQRFDLLEAANRQVKTYSGGMRRRLDLAVSLIAAPPVIFLDEPTTGLDPRSRLVVWDSIKQLMAEGVTILLTTQYLEEADQLADRIAVIDDGIVIAEGTANELKSRVGSERLELVIADEGQFHLACQLLQVDPAIQNAARRVISAPVEGGVASVRRILSLLEQAAVDVETMSLHKPTLDDVFLTLTGKQISTDEETEADHG